MNHAISIPGYFITGTGTGVGKTTFTRVLARTLGQLDWKVIAIKPVETGVDLEPSDALDLAIACGQPNVASDPAWYRARAPLSPYAAYLEGDPLADLHELARGVRRLGRTASVPIEPGPQPNRIMLVEGAGGLLVPLTRESTIADLAAEIGFPLMIVAPDRLGVLSDVSTTYETAIRRGLEISAVVLHHLPGDEQDPSRRTNARILEERLPVPILRSPFGITTDTIGLLLASSG